MRNVEVSACERTVTQCMRPLRLNRDGKGLTIRERDGNMQNVPRHTQKVVRESAFSLLSYRFGYPGGHQLGEHSETNEAQETTGSRYSFALRSTPACIYLSVPVFLPGVPEDSVRKPVVTALSARKVVLLFQQVRAERLFRSTVPRIHQQH